jgi:Arc/MetJ-type ribon-helix-helix transcriptional regulator
MQLIVPPDLETLINKRISSGAYSSAEDVLRRALEAQDSEESWTGEERHTLSAHIDEGYLQAVRGELIDGPQAQREIHMMKEDWRSTVPEDPEARAKRMVDRLSGLLKDEIAAFDGTEGFMRWVRSDEDEAV